MQQTGMKECYWKRVPQTINAVRFFGRYFDPADIRLKMVDIASACVIVAGVVISCIRLI